MNSLSLKPLRRSGHTMIEMVLSMTLLAIVMASVGSAAMFAAKASPSESNDDELIRDSVLLGRIAEDISQAKYILENTSDSVTMIVPDRTGDGVPDRIRYSWSGSAGGPLTYELNDADPALLIGSVDRFEIEYAYATATSQISPVMQYGAEKVVASYTTSLLGSDEKVKETDWWGQIINASLSGGAIGFLPTKIDLYAMADSPSNGETDFTLVQRTGATPGSTSFGSGVIREADMTTSYDWYTFAFNESSPVTSATDVALLFSYAAGDHDILTLRRANLGGGRLRSQDSGASWSYDLDKSFLYRLYGHEITKVNNGYKTSRVHVTSVQVTLEADIATGTPVTRHARLMQAPQLLESFWEADFNANPTTFDLNGDGTADFNRVGGGTLPDSQIRDGVWYAAAAIHPSSLKTTDAVLQIDMRMKASGSNKPTLFGSVNSDGTTALPVMIYLQDDGSGGQELVFCNSYDSLDVTVKYGGLSAEWIDVSVTLIPSESIISISINGQAQPTLQLTRDTERGFAGLVLMGQGAGSQISEARFTMGGTYSALSDIEALGLIATALDLLN